MNFKQSEKTLRGHTFKPIAEEIGFFNTGKAYKEVVFKTKDDIYFNAYGIILEVIK